MSESFFDHINNPPAPEAPTAISDEERAIASLADHPGLVALKAVYERHEEAWLLRIASRIKSSPKEIDQRQVDYARGHFSGASNIFGRITAAKALVDQEAQS